MQATRPLFVRLTLLVLLLIFAASMGLYWDRVPGALHAANIPTGLAQAKPLTDLYPRWYGTREFLLHKRNPYGLEVSQEIQLAYYGRILNPSAANDRLDQERFAYPFYVILFMLPTVPMEFDRVRIVAWWFLAAATAMGVWFWLRFLRVQLPFIASVAVFAVALTSVPVMQGLSLLQLGLLVACLIAAAAMSAAAGRYYVAGMLLALATIKPQMCVLPILWFAVWAFSGWRQRKSLLWGFGAMLTILILGSEFLLPGWLMQYPKALVAYSEYTHAKTFLGALLSPSQCWVVSILAVLCVGWFCWRVRRDPADSVWFAIALTSVLTLTVTILPTVNASFNQVLLLPAVLLGIRYWRNLTQANRFRRFILYSVFGFAFLPWVLALAVIVAQPNLRNGWYLKMWSAPLYSSLALPVVAVCTLVLLCRSMASSSLSDRDAARLAVAGARQ